MNLHEFVSKYNGPKLVIAAVGGGASLANLLTIPGASKVVDSIFLPYSQESILQFLNIANLPDYIKYTSEEMSILLDRRLKELRKGNYIYISISASLTSNYGRRGNNNVYVRLSDLTKSINFSIPFVKLPDDSFNDAVKYNSQRAEEEKFILTEILNQIMTAYEISN